MSLAKANEFVAFLRGQSTAAQGFTARQMYDIGMTYGITNGEMCKTFLGKSRAIARGKYLPTELDASVIASSAPVKAKVTKATPAGKKKTTETLKKEAQVQKVTKRGNGKIPPAIGMNANLDDNEDTYNSSKSASGGCYAHDALVPSKADIDDELACMKTFLND
jgi:hypothetical protein